MAEDKQSDNNKRWPFVAKNPLVIVAQIALNERGIIEEVGGTGDLGSLRKKTNSKRGFREVLISFNGCIGCFIHPVCFVDWLHWNGIETRVGITTSRQYSHFGSFMDIAGHITYGLFVQSV